MEARLKWDLRFLRLARHWAQECSKDPSTQVGAVIVDDQRRILGIGYNGFPRGVGDDPGRYLDREVKYAMVVHAEANAILNAVGPVDGGTIYTWPLFTCCDCAKLIIQAGIRRVVAPWKAPDPRREGAERWARSMEVAKMMYNEALVAVEEIDAGV